MRCPIAPVSHTTSIQGGLFGVAEWPPASRLRLVAIASIVLYFVQWIHIIDTERKTFSASFNADEGLKSQRFLSAFSQGDGQDTRGSKG